MHFFRNKLSRAPSSLEELIKINQGLTEDKQWKLLAPIQEAYHMNGAGGEFNVKFVSPDGHFEAVYNKNGELLTEANDPVNMGTYNYFGPDNAGAHTKYDVDPYYSWGNTPTSGTDGAIGENQKAASNYAKFNINPEAISYYYRVFEQANPQKYKRSKEAAEAKYGL